MEMSDSDSAENIISVMLATDIHLGVNEKDAIRGDDSFIAFEEILQISRDQNVDFILLGGDLFHDNKPSPQCYQKCLVLLRKYCMGDNPIHVEFISDQKIIFKDSPFPTVNYEDPNINISIPIFSIHGNHDDPSGFGRISALDLMSSAGYINYFGRWTDLNSVQVHPLMLKKGTTKLAIYGLSHIKDERLYRLMKHNDVEFITPSNVESFFNIMVLHQNRDDRPGTKHIPESLLPSFIDLVFWGHEHECRVKPEWNHEKGFNVTQPGSSVVTSLCEGEALPKHVAILKVLNGQSKLEPIPLKTTRPFVFDSVKLSDWNMKLPVNNPSVKIQDYIDRYIRSNLLEKAKDLVSGDPAQPELPLIRLRVEFEHDDQCFNVVKFGQTFTGKVANPIEMVLLKRKSAEKRLPRKGEVPDINPDASSFQDIHVALSELMNQYFDNLSESSKQMKVLSRVSIGEAVTRFITKHDKEALRDVMFHDVKTIRNFLEKENADGDNLNEVVAKYSEMKLNQSMADELEEVRCLLESDVRYERDTKTTASTLSHRVELSSDEDDAFGTSALSFSNNVARRSRGRGPRSRGATRGTATGPRGGRRGRGSRSSAASDRTLLDMSVTRVNTSSRRSAVGSSGFVDSGEEEEDNNLCQGTEELFRGSSYKPSPKKKMKFSFIDE